MVHMKMVNNEIYRSYRTMGCFYNLLAFYLQKQSCIVKSLSALLRQQLRNYGSLMPKKVKSSCLAPKAAKFNPLNPELNPICYLLALLGAHHFLHVSRIRVKLLTFRLLMSYIYGAPILDVSRSRTTTQHSR